MLKYYNFCIIIQDPLSISSTATGSKARFHITKCYYNTGLAFQAISFLFEDLAVVLSLSNGAFVIYNKAEALNQGIWGLLCGSFSINVCVLASLPNGLLAGKRPACLHLLASLLALSPAYWQSSHPETKLQSSAFH